LLFRYQQQNQQWQQSESSASQLKAQLEAQAAANLKVWQEKAAAEDAAKKAKYEEFQKKAQEWTVRYQTESQKFTEVGFIIWQTLRGYKCFSEYPKWDRGFRIYFNTPGILFLISQ
jgi:hypothetical protein